MSKKESVNRKLHNDTTRVNNNCITYTKIWYQLYNKQHRNSMCYLFCEPVAKVHLLVFILSQPLKLKWKFENVFSEFITIALLKSMNSKYLLKLFDMRNNFTCFNCVFTSHHCFNVNFKTWKSCCHFSPEMLPLLFISETSGKTRNIAREGLNGNILHLRPSVCF